MDDALRQQETRRVDRAFAGLDAALRAIVIFTMAAMVIVVSTQVLLRYGFNTSLDWGQDVARLLFVWTIFLAIPLGVKTGAHIGIELVVNLLPATFQRVMTRAMTALAIVLMTIVCWEAGHLVVAQWDENLPTLDVSVALFMVPVCIGAALSVLYLLPQTITGVAAHTVGMAE